MGPHNGNSRISVFSGIQCHPFVKTHPCRVSCSKHHAAIIPYLVNLKKLDTVKSIARELKQDWKDLLKSSFPRTIASLLPLRAQSSENSERAEEEKERAAWAVQCLEELKQAIGQEVNTLMAHAPSERFILITQRIKRDREKERALRFIARTYRRISSICLRVVRPSVCTSIRPVLVTALSQEPINGFLPNLGHVCILQSQ